MLLFPFISVAQTPKISSLKNNIRNAKFDTTKSRIYIHLAKEYEGFSSDSSYILYETALKFAEKANQPNYIALSMYHLARANLYITRDESKAVELANKAINIAKQVNEYTALAGSYQVISVVSYHQNIGNCFEFLNKAVSYGQRSANKNLLGDVYATISQIYFTQKKIPEAIVALKKSLDVRKKISIDDWFTSAIDYCENLELQNKFDESYKFAQTIVPYRDSLQKKHGEFVYLNDNGRLEVKLRNYKNAEEWFLRAVEFEKQRAKPDTSHLAYSFAELESLYTRNGDYKKAHEVLKELSKIRLWLAQKRQTQNSKLQITRQKAALDLEKKEVEISLLAKQKKQQTVFLVLAVIVTLILIGLLIILQRNKQRIEQQKTELSRINASKDKLFSIIAHDLRGPMASFKGLLQLIEEEALTQQEFRDLSKSLKQNVDNIHAMLENLLLWSLSQMNGIKPNLRQFEIDDMILETVSFFREVAKQKQIELKTDINVGTMVYSDENQIQTVLRNILNNAIKFTPKNGIIAIISHEVDTQILIKVVDSGKGMNQDELQKLFTKPTIKRGTAGEKGTGIGLILCKELIEQNNGHIRALSNEGTGTSFEIYLPKA